MGLDPDPTGAVTAGEVVRFTQTSPRLRPPVRLRHPTYRLPWTGVDDSSKAEGRSTRLVVAADRTREDVTTAREVDAGPSDPGRTARPTIGD
jgi:hypothetical protein